MRSRIFACALRVIGVPVFLVKWLLKAIWSLTYGFVGLLYKFSFIKSSKAGKVAYSIISITLLMGLLAMTNFIKN